MATMTIRNLDDDVKVRLRVQAAQHGRSMEEEARSILRSALSVKPKPRTGAALVADIRALVEPFGGRAPRPPFVATRGAVQPLQAVRGALAEPRAA